MPLSLYRDRGAVYAPGFWWNTRAKKNAERRGGGVRPLGFDDGDLFQQERSADLVALDDGLKDLAALDARQVTVVELHFFGGLKYEEIADYLNVGRSTVIRDIRMAQSWLRDYVAK